MASWALVAVVVLRGISEMRIYFNLSVIDLGPWGGDFHGGAWLAAQHVLSGVNPYLAPSPNLLFHFSRAFVTPPALALAALPLAHLPYGVAVALWNLADVSAMVAALRLLGVRDLRIYLLVLFSAPFVASITAGQVEGVFALLVAVAWRWRDSWPGWLAVAVLIAAKLYAIPLVIWLLVTKRVRAASLACGSAALLLVASWAAIDFHGFAQYPQLLSATSQAADREPSSQSVASIAQRLGVAHPLATLLAGCFGVGLVLVIVAAARARDAGWLCATLVGGLAASPILWEHYLVLLFVPMAIAKPRAIAPWLLTGAFWIPYGLAAGTTRAVLTLVIAATTAIVATHDLESRATPFAMPARA